MQLLALDTAQEIDDMDIPGFKLHTLKGKLKGRWSVSVSGNWRITFVQGIGKITRELACDAGSLRPLAGQANCKT
jgi:plasmid maintenance system killer protein